MLARQIVIQIIGECKYMDLQAPANDDSTHSAKLNPYVEYERLKRELPNNLEPAQYYAECQRIAEMLEI